MACLLLFLLLWGTTSPVQNSQNILSTLSLHEKQEEIAGKALSVPHQLAHWPVILGTDKLWIDDTLKARDIDYTIDYKPGLIFVNAKFEPDSVIRITYQIIPISIQKSYQRDLFAPEASPSLEGTETPSDEQPVGRTIPRSGQSDSTLTFSGAKTVSLSMESAKGLTINQPTRLNVSGNVSENVSVTAMLSDQDLPLQPEGTTEEIEDLDRILIKVQGKNLSATLGDYEAAFGETEFVLLPKMLEGAQARGEFDVGGFTLLGAVSKGQSSSVTLSGIEGQNEYRVNVDGRYIIMIAGSEKVWLNGEKMRRGEENDYVIQDYGDPIIEFTNKHLITRNDVIVVDFEYIDEKRNYRQDMYGTRGKVNLIGEELTLGVSYATESDDKDNPLILLTEDEIAGLKRNDLDTDGDGILLQAPTKLSVIGFDGRLNLGDNTNLRGEVALSKRDLNTFSSQDEPEEGKAWKLNGSSGFDKFRIDFDFRQLDPEFVPVGATFSSRTRSTYQESYDDITFGDVLPTSQTPPGEASYDVDVWYKPIEYMELRGDLGKTSSEYVVDLSEISKRSTDHWSRSIKINLPDLPQINTRYQEALTAIDDMDDTKKTRELWQLDHKLWGKLDIGARNENLESIYYGDISEAGRDRKREERRLMAEIPTFKNVSLSGEYSFETEYANAAIDTWSKSSSANTASANLSAKLKSWLDVSGYFARRKFSAAPDAILSGSSQTPTDSTTNLADLKLGLKWLRINYQIDKKLSSEREEQYVNYIITRVDGIEEKRFLEPGEGSYVKIDEYTYREDSEEGEYIRLVRTVRDRPVTSLAMQSVFSLRPRSSFRTKIAAGDQKNTPSLASRLKGILSMLEIGARISEEQESASRKFYLLQDSLTDNTIYGLRKYWYRTQLSPSKRLLVMANWETNRTINKRINSRIREFSSDRWSIELNSPLTTRLSLGGEWEQDNTAEMVSSILETESSVVSDISERQQSRSLFLRYSPSKTLSRIKLEGAYETEWDEDVLSEEPPVFTKTFSFGSEAAWRFRSKGTATIRYQIARGTSSGELPFARYDFHEGISHRIKLETNYRIKWFTDVMARFIYRAEITEQEKPDHRLEMEMTANF